MIDNNLFPSLTDSGSYLIFFLIVGNRTVHMVILFFLLFLFFSILIQIQSMTMCRKY